MAERHKKSKIHSPEVPHTNAVKPARPHLTSFLGETLKDLQRDTFGKEEKEQPKKRAASQFK